MTPLEFAAFRKDAVPHMAPIDWPPPSMAPHCPPDLRRVTASLAHNVNNALLGIMANLELVLRDIVPGTEAHARQQSAIFLADRLAERVRRLIAFVLHSESESPRVVCLCEVVQDVARLINASRPDIEVQIFAHTGDCRILAHQALLQLVVEQIVCNALEGMPKGGTLCLRVLDEPHRRCLVVTDSGCGISAEVRAHLFDSFFTTKASGHLGLGLTLCQSALDCMGGVLHLTSTEGQGTTATLCLPPYHHPDNSVCTSAMASATPAS